MHDHDCMLVLIYEGLISSTTIISTEARTFGLPVPKCSSSNYSRNLTS